MIGSRAWPTNLATGETRRLQTFPPSPSETRRFHPKRPPDNDRRALDQVDFGLLLRWLERLLCALLRALLAASPPAQIA